MQNTQMITKWMVLSAIVLLILGTGCQTQLTPPTKGTAPTKVDRSTTERDENLQVVKSIFEQMGKSLRADSSDFTQKVDFLMDYYQLAHPFQRDLHRGTVSRSAIDCGLHNLMINATAEQRERLYRVCALYHSMNNLEKCQQWQALQNGFTSPDAKVRIATYEKYLNGTKLERELLRCCLFAKREIPKITFRMPDRRLTESLNETVELRATILVGKYGYWLSDDTWRDYANVSHPEHHVWASQADMNDSLTFLANPGTKKAPHPMEKLRLVFRDDAALTKKKTVRIKSGGVLFWQLGLKRNERSFSDYGLDGSMAESHAQASAETTVHFAKEKFGKAVNGLKVEGKFLEAQALPGKDRNRPGFEVRLWYVGNDSVHVPVSFKSEFSATETPFWIMILDESGNVVKQSGGCAWLMLSYFGRVELTKKQPTLSQKMVPKITLQSGIYKAVIGYGRVDAGESVWSGSILSRPIEFEIGSSKTSAAE